jgi:hypothetical protein
VPEGPSQETLSRWWRTSVPLCSGLHPRRFWGRRAVAGQRRARHSPCFAAKAGSEAGSRGAARGGRRCRVLALHQALRCRPVGGALQSYPRALRCPGRGAFQCSVLEDDEFQAAVRELFPQEQLVVDAQA